MMSDETLRFDWQSSDQVRKRMFAAQAKARLVSTHCSDTGSDLVAKHACCNYDLDVASDKDDAQKAGYLRRNGEARAFHQHDARNSKMASSKSTRLRVLKLARTMYSPFLMSSIIEVDPLEGSETDWLALVGLDHRRIIEVDPLEGSETVENMYGGST